jgi:hypothetical protein
MKYIMVFVMLIFSLSLCAMDKRTPLKGMTVEEFNRQRLEKAKQEEAQKKQQQLIARVKAAQELTTSDEKVFSEQSEHNGFIPDYYDHGIACTII